MKNCKGGVSIKRRKVFIICIGIFIIAFVVLHSSQKLALRTHLVVMGHPIIAFKTQMTDDVLHNTLNDKSMNKDLSVHYYSLTIPPYDEEISGTYLKNYRVKHKMLLYFAEYWGEA